MCDFKPFEVDSYKYDAKYVCKTSDKGIYVPYDTGDHHYFFNMTYNKDDIPKELKELFGEGAVRRFIDRDEDDEDKVIPPDEYAKINFINVVADVAKNYLDETK